MNSKNLFLNFSCQILDISANLCYNIYIRKEKKISVANPHKENPKMKNLMLVFEKLANQKLTISERAGVKVIQATELAKIKAELMSALASDLNEMFNETVLAFNVGFTADGLVATVENDSVDSVNGEVAIQFDVKVKNLEYDFATENEMFLETQAVKANEKAIAEQNKAAKIKKDAEDRAERDRMKALRKKAE